MAKSEDDVRSRLQRAALDLFAQHGYDRTTAAGIAARAGVTERTFFRHFADKREVLFDGEAILRTALTASIAAAPGSLSPLDTLFAAFLAVAPLLEANRPFAVPRQAVIVTTPALAEREQAKVAALAGALARALEARGVPALPAALAAGTGMAAFAHVTTAWLDKPDPPLAERLAEASAELKRLLA